MQIQFYKVRRRIRIVVICFKFSNFAYANTVFPHGKDCEYQLLFALNLVTLLMQIQYKIELEDLYISCYLL